jgi:hypothetical protein
MIVRKLLALLRRGPRRSRTIIPLSDEEQRLFDELRKRRTNQGKKL